MYFLSLGVKGLTRLITVRTVTFPEAEKALNGGTTSGWFSSFSRTFSVLWAVKLTWPSRFTIDAMLGRLGKDSNTSYFFSLTSNPNRCHSFWMYRACS